MNVSMAQVNSNEINDIEKTELHYGIKDGRVVHVESVINGLDCGCSCPHCDSQLIAKKGNVRVHHFAHYNAVDCEHGSETAIHLLAKQIIAERKVVQLPATSLKQMTLDTNVHPHHVNEFIPTKLEMFESVEEEPTMEGYRPDLTALGFDGEWLDIEIKVTHEVDDFKATAQIERRRNMLEINLSQVSRVLPYKELEEVVLYSAPRHFIYSQEHHKINLVLEAELEEKIKYVDNLIHNAQPKSSSGLTTKCDEAVMLIGYKIGSGFSTKNQSDFKIAHLFYVKPVQSKDTANFSINGSKGFEVEQVDVKETLSSKLEGLDFPVEVKLQYEPKPGFGRRTKWIVSDITEINL
ncbi:competence protein CoiA family protein [Colwellia sp. 1_MG-2023]|uniref:competence protein CoiA family protein n=1 Tax=Colwellia sp. 1_MG-2023 TaxID=3062649 RepID=UPI0026E3FDE3|nr:competence protein CoiA family protein [Colwellia sp. 1_MG-2023]MDO6444602.1 competence protein CoiA family protein [Colwellia sp. 1_MG-2023]